MGFDGEIAGSRDECGAKARQSCHGDAALAENRRVKSWHASPNGFWCPTAVSLIKPLNYLPSAELTDTQDCGW
jgi:hypothetical protein